MLLPPCEVVVVLDLLDDRVPEKLDDGIVNDMVIGRSVLAHEFHGGPVFRSFFVSVKPGEVAGGSDQFGVKLLCKLCVMVGNRSACPAASAVREESEVGSCCKTDSIVGKLDFSKLYKMIA